MGAYFEKTKEFDWLKMIFRIYVSTLWFYLFDNAGYLLFWCKHTSAVVNPDLSLETTH